MAEFNSVLLDGGANLYWSLLLTWILTVCVTIFSLFYMHRIVAFIITKVLYFTLWKRHKVHVSVHSFKISVLGGRVFFKNLTIINKDFTISILHGTLTWRYWLLNTREPAFMNDTPENAKLPCRFLLQLYGFEIFMYNRTAAYDEILRQLKLDRNQARGQTQNKEQDSEPSLEKLSDSIHSLSSQSDNRADECVPPKWFKVLPVGILFHKCCVVVGNDTVESVLTMTSDNTEGSLDLMRPSCRLDLAQFNINLKNSNVKVHFTPNLAYQKNDSSSTNPDNLLTKRRKLIQALLGLASKLVPKAKSHKLERAMTLDYFVRQWNGLSRYAAFDDELGDTMFSSLNEEYARYSNIVSADSLDVVYFFDIPGRVPVEPDMSTGDSITPNIGNNGPPPLSGLSISSSNALIHYGPWADRQRYSLQQMVFPYLCRDHAPIEKLKPGDIRKYTDFKITFEVEDTLTLRVPFKESSKNASFLQSLKDRFGEDVNLETINTKRPFAWLELKTNKKSNVSISSGSVPLEDGWKNLVNIYLKDIEVRTSINHNVLIKATEHVVFIDMSAPLAWNGYTNWTADLKSKDADFFLLREHVTLMLDLFDDFGSGNPTPYEMFKPFHYYINWTIDNYKLYLNINDSNIINNSVDLNDNTFVCISGASTTCNISIPLETIVRKHNTVSYKIRTDMFHMSLSLPPWHTLSSFCDNKEVGRAVNFELEGEYTYYSVLDINAVDTVIIKCTSEDTTLQTYGWIIRYIMIIKENYFGENIHFKTLDEFHQAKANENMGTGNETNIYSRTSDDLSTINRSKSFSLYSKLFESSSNVPKPEDDDSIDRQTDDSSIDTELSSDTVSDTDSKNNKHSMVLPRTTNETDILFSFCVKNGTIVLPENIYKCNESHVALNFDSLDIDIRFTNYYMDLQANLSPAKGFEVENTSSNEVLFQRTISRVYDDWTPDIQIDGLAVHGHRIFGLPPLEPTYFCKWDFVIGSVLIDSEPRFLDRLVNALHSLAFGYKDVENMLIIDIPVIHDVLCLSLDLKSVDVKIKNSLVLLQLCLKELSLTLNDLANSRYTSRVDLDIPRVTARLFDVENDRKMIAGFETFLVLTNFSSKQNSDEFRRLQAEHVTLHDGPTHRMPFIIPKDLRHGIYKHEEGSIKPSFSLPELPVPLNYSSIDIALSGLPERVQASIQQDVDNISFANSMENNDDTLRLTTDYDENDINMVKRSNNGLGESNIVVKFSKVYAFSSMGGFASLISLFEDVNSFTLENTMDKLTFDIVSNLSDFSQPLAEKLCFKVVLPEIHFKLGEFSIPPDTPIQDILETTQPLENAKLLDVRIVNSSVTFSTEERRPIVNDIADILLAEKELLAAVQVKSIHAKLVNTTTNQDSYDMFSILLSEVNFWANSSETRFGDIGSVDIKDIEVDLRQEELADVLAWAQEADRHIHDLSTKLETLSSLRDEALAYLVYATCQEEAIYKVPHDPSVITKPTHILRTSTSHIRGNISWKIVARTRHVLHHLPKEWRIQTNRDFVNKSWKRVDKNEAHNLVVNAFNNWRSWEFENMDECYFFKYVLPEFDLSTNTNSDDKTFNKIFTVSLGRFLFKLGDDINDSTTAFFKVTQLGFELVRKKEPLTDNSLLPVQLATDFFLDIQCSLKVAHFSSKMTKDLKVVKDAFDNVSFTKYEKVSHKPVAPALPTVFNFDFQATEILSTFTLLKSSLVLSVSQTAGSCYLIHEEASSIIPITFNASIKKASSVVVFDTDAHMLSGSLKDTTLNLSSIGTLAEGLKKVDIYTDLVSFKSLQDQQTWILVLTSLNEEIPIITSWISKGPKSSENSMLATDKNPLPFLPFPLMVVFNSHLISIDLEILSAFKVVTDVEKLELGVECNKDLSFINLEVSRSGLKVLQREFQERGYVELLRGSIDVFSLDSKASINNENQPSLDVSTTVGSSYMIIPTLIKGLKNFAKTYDLVIGNINAISTLIKSLVDSNIDKETSYSNENDLQKGTSVWLLDFAALLSNISIIVKEPDSNIKLILDEINFHCANYDDALPVMKIIPFFGIADLSSIILRMDFKNPINKNFNIVSLGLQLKLLHFEEEDNLQNVQVISTYTRVFLNSFLLLKLVHFYDKLSNAVSELPRKKCIETTKSAQPTIDETITNTLESYSIHVLLHNFCIGWIYGTERFQYPGIILGYEKAFVIFHKAMGKISFLGFYLSLAHGATPSDFYASGNEFESPNCASLPTFKFVYSIAKDGPVRNLHAQLSGELLKIKFEAGTFYTMDHLIDSINSTKELLNQRDRFTNIKSNPEPGCGNNNSVKGISFFSSIKCLSTFDGAQIIISSKSYSHHNNLPLQMDFPAVKILTDYAKRLTTTERPHLVNVHVGISGSDNLFDATSTYVILEVFNEVKRIINKPQSPKTPKMSADVAIGPESHLFTTLEPLFADIEFNFCLSLKPQKLSLSCEPKAKVKMVIALDEVTLYLNSNENLDHCVSSLLQVTNINAYLQHIYSRETSGSLRISELLLDGIYEAPKSGRKMAAIGDISAIDFYINMKQLQDIDLFKDIWFPREAFSSSSPSKEKKNTFASPNISMLNAYRRVSQTVAVQWIFALILRKVTSKVDLGRSLGLVTLTLEDLDILSQRQINWDQMLKICFKSINCSTEGRLGGVLFVDNVKFNSSLFWDVAEMKERLTETPFVSLSLDMEALQIKTSLDYHNFFIAQLALLRLEVFNEKGDELSQSSVVGRTSLGSVDLYLTVLAASNFMDIYSNIQRMRHDIRFAYTEVLNDSKLQAGSASRMSSIEVLNDRRKKHMQEKLIDAMDLLLTKLEVSLNSIVVHIFPVSLLEPEVLMVKFDQIKATFDQSCGDALVNSLDLQLNGVRISLSTVPGGKEEETVLETISISEYIKRTKGAYGGTIFVFPSVTVMMKSWQDPETKVVEYIYECYFSGNVDIKWNLGTINFIKEMWTTHARALSSRLNNIGKLSEIEESADRRNLSVPHTRQPSILETVDIEEKINMVATETTFEYIAKKEPIIDTPQLKDLGIATPPLEWLGVHRNQFPILTHRFVIIGLQKMVHQVEIQYVRLLK
ncbi:Protein required for fermentation at low temperature [Komagataella phaffii CBS 7435]|uniref:Protein required for fermentation at low temperature n=1 Tax=Komagataella phaffii (strain ATCC 76273 / CBS 7435 / CECT 11047 / NRRL Y-11430 / Wegner 21-1) TaxID=981350 RepID=F2QQB6_KOMPC|nr:GQ67_01464T0 [Komagataella phaffii]AOA66620.1 GQ68_01480T0 [Komagataella phaffii GS115]CAH2447361.1 Protein required for fermentation at low temperature [Komagataella phaffii CBS 7435]CCA37594.2 Protein required for fermentation at low temperature [Komagataella phaffii CBS 7435]